jgi:putative transposase
VVSTITGGSTESSRSAEASVGSRGDSYDNALAETIIGLHETERSSRRQWTSIEDELATLEKEPSRNHRQAHADHPPLTFGPL